MKNRHYLGLELNKILEEVKSLTAFSLGKKNVEELEVSFNPLVIGRLNAQIKEALEIVVHFGSIPLDGIKDVQLELHAILKDQLLSGQDILNIAETNDGINKVISFIKNLDNEYSAINDLIASLEYFPILSKSIYAVINQYGEVRDDASSRLKNLKNSLSSIEKDIQTTLSRFIRENASALQETTISYRNNRACVLLKATYKNSYNGFHHGDTASKLATYVEPDFLVSLNNTKQGLMEDIEEEVKRIIYELCCSIKPFAENLISQLDTLGILDGVFAKAIYGKKHEGVVANIVNDRCLLLSKARHPLIDSKQVVSNTYRIDDKYRILMITGSNTGGKTVSLKVIGLSVLMTYLGIPVLCDEANVPYYDNVFEDITDDQSIADSLSTFSSHLKKLSLICNKATNNSLVLLDELGSGTDPKDGECLAISVLEYLKELGVLTVCTTHYGGLKKYGQQNEDVLLATVEFNQELLQPTYRFIEGAIGQSNAFDIAAKFGFKKGIIENAVSLRDETRSIDENLINDLQAKIALQIGINDELISIKEDIITRQNELDQLVNNFEDYKQKELARIQEDARRQYNEIEAKATAMLNELKEKETVKIHEAIEVKRKIEDLFSIDEDDEVSDEGLLLNDYVRLIQTNQIGQVIEIGRSNIQVLVNGVKIRTKKMNLMKTSKPKEVKSRFKSTSFSTKTMSNECMLIGLSYDEANSCLSKFVDDALVHNLKYIRIVHGHGQGVLRKMVHEYLRGLPYVKKFELAMASDGGQGATVCELK